MPSSQQKADYSREIIELTTQSTIAAIVSDGTFSRVYLCYDNTSVPRSSSTCKVVKVYSRKTAEMRSHRIMAEKVVWQTINSTRNPFIGELLGTVKDSTYLYFLMSAYHCGHIGLHIRGSEYGRFSPLIARNYTVEILSGLLAIVKCGCLHRDIKASNCLIDRHGHVKICDFGASKLLFEPGNYSAVMKNCATMSSRTYTIIGTMQYMAPEIIARTGGYSFEVDWWACGVLLYEMVCGSLPSFQNVPTIDNKDAIAAVALGLWPSQEASLIALAAIKRPAESMAEIPATEALAKSFQRLESWCPTPSDNDKVILSSSPQHLDAWSLIQGLLVAHPQDRLGPRAPNILKDHQFFQGINWEDVENGISPSPDPGFDRSLGFLDLDDGDENVRTAEEINIDAKPFKDF
jgi:serine/threonine protein kinase